MISDDVRSTNGRPRASTPVTTRGTACTIRVLRRFLNSVFGLAPDSEAISIVSSAKLPPAVCSQEKHPNFSSDPDWPNEQINRSLEKRRVVAFHPVSEKQKYPAAKE